MLSLFLVGCGGNQVKDYNSIGTNDVLTKQQIMVLVQNKKVKPLQAGAIGQSMDENDIIETQHALFAQIGQPQHWTNSNQNQYTVIPTRVFKDNRGQYCCEYATVAVIEGKRHQMFGRACRQPKNLWESTE